MSRGAAIARGPARRARGGFTLIEMMIAMVIGVIVLTASTSLVQDTMRSLAGVQLRDGIDRNARFIGIALQRDVQETGVGLQSLFDFGTLATYGDTVSVLSVPYFVIAGQPDRPAEAYGMSFTLPLVVGAGNCGLRCIEVVRDTAPFQIQDGDLAYVQLSATVRRLIHVTSVTFPAADRARINFSGSNRLFGHAAGILGLNLGVGGVTVTKGLVTSFWRDAAQNQLMRATRLTAGDTPDGETLATGVQAWATTLVFTDGDEATAANPDPAIDPTNNYDDIVRLHVRATLQAERSDPRVNNGVLLTRQYDWWYAPRNLRYERNRG